MAVTDQAILSEIQRTTLENLGDNGANWPSGMWTQAEVLGYLNQRQNRLLTACGLFWKVAEVGVTTGQAEQANPSDWIATVFLAVKSAAGVYRELPKMDALELDYILPSWPSASAASPRGYYEIDGQTLTTFVAPIPTEVGSALERYYVALGTTLTAAGGGVNFSVSDELVPTIKYGCLADMFGKVGEGQHLPLAAACEARWTEGLELAKVMATEGWFAL
jgi:hypothetical protein